MSMPPTQEEEDPLVPLKEISKDNDSSLPISELEKTGKNKKENKNEGLGERLTEVESNYAQLQVAALNSVSPQFSISNKAPLLPTQVEPKPPKIKNSPI